MKKLALITACAAVLACASGSSTSSATEPGTATTAKIVQPSVQLVQLVGPADLNFPPGNFDVQYGVRIENRGTEEITLRQIVLEPFGAGGPYRVLRDRYFFKQAVPAGGSHELTFWAHAQATGNSYSIDANAPVTVRATAHFDSPSGAFRKVLTANFGQ